MDLYLKPTVVANSLEMLLDLMVLMVLVTARMRALTKVVMHLLSKTQL
jgi:hypothetical protein